MNKYLKNIFYVIIGSFVYLGGFLITSGSGGLNDKAVAGGPSVTKFTQSNYTELKPSGNPNNTEMNIETTSPMLEEIIYLIKAFILA